MLIRGVPALTTGALALIGIAVAARAEGPKPAPPVAAKPPARPGEKPADPTVPERCLAGLKPRGKLTVQAAALSAAELVVLVDHPAKPSLIGLCGTDGPLRGAVTLPRVDSYADACSILGKSCVGPGGDVGAKLEPGVATLEPRFFEVAPGEWAVSVERSASADTGSESGGPGEEVSITTLYVFRVAEGKLALILMMPLRASRSDVELSDRFDTSVSQESVGVLQFERTIQNGVYPDGQKTRTRRGHLRWNGKRLVLGP
jgi:hypothetical protein